MDHCYFQRYLWSGSVVHSALFACLHPPSAVLIPFYMVTIFYCVKSTMGPSNTITVELHTWSREGDVTDAASICFVSALYDLHVRYWIGLFTRDAK